MPIKFIVPFLKFQTRNCSLLMDFNIFIGKTPSLFRHDLNGLHSKQSDRLTISMNAMHKIPSKFVPKKFALSSKVANTRGTTKCCVGRNPYNGYKYLCGATSSGVFLMQWYDPLNKFMLLKVSFSKYTNVYKDASYIIL